MSITRHIFGAHRPSGEGRGLTPRARTSLFQRIKGLRSHRRRAPAPPARARLTSTVAVVPIAEINSDARVAVEAALALRADAVIAVHVRDLCACADSRWLEREWDAWGPRITMVFLDGRAGNVATPIIEYVRRNHPRAQVFVFISHRHRAHTSDDGITYHHANQLQNACRHEPGFVICQTPPTRR